MISPLGRSRDGERWFRKLHWQGKNEIKNRRVQASGGVERKCAQAEHDSREEGRFHSNRKSAEERCVQVRVAAPRAPGDGLHSRRTGGTSNWCRIDGMTRAQTNCRMSSIAGRNDLPPSGRYPSPKSRTAGSSASSGASQIPGRRKKAGSFRASTAAAAACRPGGCARSQAKRKKTLPAAGPATRGPLSHGPAKG